MMDAIARGCFLCPARTLAGGQLCSGNAYQILSWQKKEMDERDFCVSECDIQKVKDRKAWHDCVLRNIHSDTHRKIQRPPS